jgi:phosphatidylglycerol:prolipoprotein diacylglycerol transferase
VSGPLIPYIDGQSYEIPIPFVKDLVHALPFIGDKIDPSTPLTIKPFGMLVAIGVYVGAVITMRRARERKLDTALMSDFIFWVVATGFVLSHMLDAIFYHPKTVAEDPLYLFKIWDGLSSYGGFIGAIIGAIAWRVYRKKPILEMVDVTVSAFPVAWIFGRAGCSIVHDHPGAISDRWFAVQYPKTVCPPGFPPEAVCGRYDLGFIEMVLTIPLAIACWWLWKKRPLRPHGFYVAVTLTAYAPVRFFLDFLRVPPNEMVFRGATDLRYGSLTPAQWACFLGLGLGLFFLKKTMKGEYVPTAEVMATDEPDAEAEGEPEEQEERATKRDKVDASGKRPRVKKKKKKKVAKKKAVGARPRTEEPEPTEGS